ncbi:MAG TPA: hypothetical protein DCR32_07890 [Opitutae bacterium]|jgi:hypothetical protein|nr:hypothetical protein [Opitutae bacterium]
MRSCTGFQFFLCLVLGLLPRFGVAQTSETLDFVEGRYFEVVGTDNRSVSFVNTLGEHVAELCATYLQVGSHEFRQRIFVALRPVEHVEFDGDYQINTGARGQVSLDFRWEATLKLETVCRALTEAYIVRYANFNYGVEASEHIRYWVMSALGSQSYLSLRPAQQGQYIQEARQAPLLKVTSLLSLKWGLGREGELSPRQGYWVLYAMRQRGLLRSDVGVLLDRAVAGMDVSVALELAIQPTDADQQASTLDRWWQRQMADYLAQETEYYESLDASRVWIAELANFDTYRASGGELENLMGLWTQRDNQTLRAILAARREIIALRMERVNPAYFNSAQSLGALYETALESNRRFEFIHAFTTHLSDWENTKRLHDMTDELLDASLSE